MEPRSSVLKFPMPGHPTLQFDHLFLHPKFDRSLKILFLFTAVAHQGVPVSTVVHSLYVMFLYMNGNLQVLPLAPLHSVKYFQISSFF